MRDFLNAILAFIGAESLTDDEFDSVVAGVAEPSQFTYDDLARILAEREAVTDTLNRLEYYFKAKGVELTPLVTGKSNVFLGSVL